MHRVIKNSVLLNISEAKNPFLYAIVCFLVSFLRKLSGRSLSQVGGNDGPCFLKSCLALCVVYDPGLLIAEHYFSNFFSLKKKNFASSSLLIVLQNDLIHAWGLDYQLGYCAQASYSFFFFSLVYQCFLSLVHCISFVSSYMFSYQESYRWQGDRTKNIGIVDAEYIFHYGHPTLGGTDENKVNSWEHNLHSTEIWISGKKLARHLNHKIFKFNEIGLRSR